MFFDLLQRTRLGCTRFQAALPQTKRFLTSSGSPLTAFILTASVDAEVPFSDYPGMLRFMRGNLLRKRDNWLGIEGPEGSGKTTVGMNIALDLKPDFSVARDAIFTVAQLLDVLAEGRKGELYFLDEAANIFYNRDWSTWESKELTKLGRQMRIMRSTWIILMPDFDGLDPYIREKRIRTRIYQPPYYDGDGMTNGPAKVLWKTERFDYTEQRVTHRWVDLWDLPVHPLDGHPEWDSYEARKEGNFQTQVKAMRQRLHKEQQREERREAKEEAKKIKAAPGKKQKPAVPPTTT